MDIGSSIPFHTCSDSTSMYADYTNKDGHKCTRVFCYMCGKKRFIGTDYKEVTIDPQTFDVMTAAQLIANALYFKSLLNRISWMCCGAEEPAFEKWNGNMTSTLILDSSQDGMKKLVMSCLNMVIASKILLKVTITRDWAKAYAIKHYEAYKVSKDIIKPDREYKS